MNGLFILCVLNKTSLPHKDKLINFHNGYRDTPNTLAEEKHPRTPVPGSTVDASVLANFIKKRCE